MTTFLDMKRDYEAEAIALVAKETGSNPIVIENIALYTSPNLAEKFVPIAVRETAARLKAEDLIRKMLRVMREARIRCYGVYAISHLHECYGCFCGGITPDAIEHTSDCQVGDLEAQIAAASAYIECPGVAGGNVVTGAAASQESEEK